MDAITTETMAAAADYKTGCFIPALTPRWTLGVAWLLSGIPFFATTSFPGRNYRFSPTTSRPSGFVSDWR
jgi:hypothetical protein